MDVNVMEHIDSETGKFTESFAGQISAIAGEEHKDTKLFEKVPDVATLIKVALDTKSALGKKQEFQRPGENATDAEKTAFRKALQKELGAPESSDDYEFARPDDLPEGMRYLEEVEKVYRELFHEEGVSLSTAKRITDKFNEVQRKRFNDRLEAENKKFEENSTELKKDWKGDNLVKNARTAFKAIMQVGTEDLTKLLKDAKIFDAAADLGKWRGLGFSPKQLRIWHNIGTLIKSDDAITNEGGPVVPEGEASDTKKVVTKMYDHPTSVAARKERAAQKK